MTRQRSPQASAPFCPVRDVLAEVVDRWSLLVLLLLGRRGRCRFTGLRTEIPDISPRMLALTLKRLQAHDVVARFAFAEVPPRVEYKLTPRGEALVVVLEGLEAWAVGQQRRHEVSGAAHD